MKTVSLKSTEQVTSLTTELETEKAKLTEHEKLIKVKDEELIALRNELKSTKDSSELAMNEKMTEFDVLKLNSIS